MSEKMYIAREIESFLFDVSRQFAAVALSGPRQSGKTTLLKHLFEKEYQFFTFDDPLTRERALSDPKLFLSDAGEKVILDEIQYVPELVPYIKIYIDQNRNKKGQFLLTGSQQFHLIQNLTESLAGRVALLNLLPFGFSEQQRHFDKNQQQFDLYQLFVYNAFRGGFPEINLNEEQDQTLWYGSYIQTYLERDVRQISNIGDLRTFQRFLQLLATRCGQTINYSYLAGELGINHKTVKNWISVLEASQLIYLLKPYYKNIGKRISKNPKVYFLDLGLVTYLTGIETEKQLVQGPMAGQLFENYIVQEVIKFYYNSGRLPPIYYLATHNQLEIDLLIEKNMQLYPVEIKLAKTLNTRMCKSIQRLRKLFLDLPISNGFILSLAEEEITLTENIRAMRLDSLLELMNNNFEQVL